METWGFFSTSPILENPLPSPSYIKGADHKLHPHYPQMILSGWEQDNANNRFQNFPE
jgi:hypothetical protein